MTRNLAAFLAAATFDSQAMTLPDHILEYQRLDVECGEWGVSKYCAKRDAALNDLREHGWCLNRAPPLDAEWGPCPGWPRPTWLHHNGAWFSIAHHFLLKDALEQCRQYEIAGNNMLANACRTLTLNAHDYLLVHAQIGRLPQEAWSLCGSAIQINMAVGAQCIGAAEEICKTDDSGALTNQRDCFSVMSSGAWVANPAAARLTFDFPARKAP